MIGMKRWCSVKELGKEGFREGSLLSDSSSTEFLYVT